MDIKEQLQKVKEAFKSITGQNDTAQNTDSTGTIKAPVALSSTNDNDNIASQDNNDKSKEVFEKLNSGNEKNSSDISEIKKQVADLKGTFESITEIKQAFESQKKTIESLMEIIEGMAQSSVVAPAAIPATNTPINDPMQEIAASIAKQRSKNKI